MDNLASMLKQQDEREWVACVTRLYLVVHGRPPDRGGLLGYVQQMRDGKTLRQIAAEFVVADEFTSRVRSEDAPNELYRNASGLGEIRTLTESSHQTLGDLANFLVLSPEVQSRFPILPALYPDGVPLDNPDDYRIWLMERPNVKFAGRDRYVVTDKNLMLSLIMPISNPSARWLEIAIRSALAQTFPCVELLIVTRGRFPKVARQQAEQDSRIRLVKAPVWSGTASLFNRALDLCKGQFTGLIGQHDQLAKTAAAELAAVTAAADIVLSDDDALDEHGLRHSPRLGVAWDPDRVIASGCPGLILARTALLRQVGGMRRTHGREEWDLLLRASAEAETRITHLPSILLSRRDRTRAAPHGGHRAHLAAVRRYLSTMGHGDCTVRSESGTLRVIYPLPRTPPLTSVIIPTRDRADLMRTCIDGLLQRTAYPDMEVVIIDNGSIEPDAVALLQDLSRDRRVRVLSQPGPFNWSALNNFGVDQMRGEVAVLLNNDTDVIDPGWLRELVSQAIRPEVGIVGAKLLYADRTLQHAGVVLGPAGRATHMWRHAPSDARGYLDQLITTRQVTVVTGACLAVRRDVYLTAGCCDAEHLPVTWNDSDLCLRVRALGLRVIWTPHACLLHLEQATRGTDETPERQHRFARERDWMRTRWNGAIDADPFLNPSILPSEAQPRPHLAVV